MRRVVTLYRSSVGKKVLMALSGVVLVLFVIVHMLGNLKVFMGPEAFNHYAEWFRVIGEPVLPRTVGLWMFRVMLLACVGITAAILRWRRGEGEPSADAPSTRENSQ